MQPVMIRSALRWAGLTTALLLLVSGMVVAQVAQTQTNQSMLATSSNSYDDDNGRDDDDYYGFIESRPAGTAGEWVISGRSFTATDATELDADDGPLVVGACVSVDYEGSIAEEIESEPPGDCATSAPIPTLTPSPGDDDYYGFIESRPTGTAGTWVISGRSFTATDATELDADDGPLVVGACVSVDYEGSIAEEIESEPPGDCATTPSRNARCFDETGQCIDGRIRDYWEQNGGLPVFGFPISEQRTFTIEGQPIEAQWFERNRLELHPENAPPYDVLLGRLGVDVLAQQGRAWQTFPTDTEPQAGCRYFAETQQNVCGEILAAWQANGLELGDPGISARESLALFGLPISPLQEEEIEGETYQVQWFERARFEQHPENVPPFNVLLGLLGREATP